jgi:hypothetical protein
MTEQDNPQSDQPRSARPPAEFSAQELLGFVVSYVVTHPQILHTWLDWGLAKLESKTKRGPDGTVIWGSDPNTAPGS